MLLTYRSHRISISCLYCTQGHFIKATILKKGITTHTIQKKVIILGTIQTDNLIGAFNINSILGGESHL